MLATQRPIAQPGWSAWFARNSPANTASARSMKHVAHEVRFILDAYLVRNFKKLNLLTETPEKTFAVRRYSALQPLSLAAMIYTVGARSGARVVPFADLHGRPGSPGRMFALDAATLRQMVETLHQREWVRIEVRHGLDQLRLDRWIRAARISRCRLRKPSAESCVPHHRRPRLTRLLLYGAP